MMTGPDFFLNWRFRASPWDPRDPLGSSPTPPMPGPEAGVTPEGAGGTTEGPKVRTTHGSGLALMS